MANHLSRHDRAQIDPAKLRRVTPDWVAEAAADAVADLRNLAARHPDRFEWRDGKLYPRRGPR
jgi:hypothetical protein